MYVVVFVTVREITEMESIICDEGEEAPVVLRPSVSVCVCVCVCVCETLSVGGQKWDVMTLLTPWEWRSSIN